MSLYIENTIKETCFLCFSTDRKLNLIKCEHLFALKTLLENPYFELTTFSRGDTLPMLCYECDGRLTKFRRFKEMVCESVTRFRMLLLSGIPLPESKTRLKIQDTPNDIIEHYDSTESGSDAYIDIAKTEFIEVPIEFEKRKTPLVIWASDELALSWYESERHQYENSEQEVAVSRNTTGRKKPNITCKICKNKFLNLSDVYEHYKKHYIHYGCKMCTFNSRDYEETRLHCAEYQHSDSEIPSESIKSKYKSCKKCEMAFSRQSHLVRHRVQCYGRRYECEFCDQTFGHRNTKYAHVMFRHKQVQALECDICGRKCKNIFTLRGHKKKHAIPGKGAGNSYYCATCDIHFRTKAAFQVHCRSCKRSRGDRTNMDRDEETDDETGEDEQTSEHQHVTFDVKIEEMSLSDTEDNSKEITTQTEHSRTKNVPNTRKKNDQNISTKVCGDYSSEEEKERRINDNVDFKDSNYSSSENEEENKILNRCTKRNSENNSENDLVKTEFSDQDDSRKREEQKRKYRERSKRYRDKQRALKLQAQKNTKRKKVKVSS